MEKLVQRLPNGESIAYLAQGNGKTPLVLLHGNLSSSVFYQPLLDRLPSTIRVIAPDLRGFGDSSYEHRFDSLQELAEDIKSLLTILKVKQIDLVGWSLGGGVAMELCATYPELVKHLILINSTSHKGYPIFQKNAQNQPLFGQVYQKKDDLAKDPLQVLPVTMAITAKNAAFMTYIYDLTIYTVKKPTLEANKIYIEEALKERCLVDADFGLATLNLSDSIGFYGMGNGKIKNIQCPVLHVWGTSDRTVPEMMILDNIKAMEKTSTYLRWEDCGHSPLVDQPDKLTQSILDFLR